jgi:hypothetical protein
MLGILVDGFDVYNFGNDRNLLSYHIGVRIVTATVMTFNLGASLL